MGAHTAVMHRPDPRSEPLAPFLAWKVFRGTLRAWARSAPLRIALALFVLSLTLLSLGSLPAVSAAPTPSALPHESPVTLVNDAERSVPTPAGVPAGMTEMNAANHPCWPLDPNGSACIQVDIANYSQPDLIPVSPNLNTSWNYYPYASEDIHFQVLSVWNIGNCVTYDVPDWMGTCNTVTGEGPSAMYTGWDSYLYLSVIDVLWQDVCWFCDTDGTQWHANAGIDWAPTTGEPYDFNVPTYNGAIPPAGHPTNWVFDINISAAGSTGGENFPNGTWVNWNITMLNWTQHTSTDTWTKNQYCAPQCAGDLHGGMFYYFTRNFWYYDVASPGSDPEYGPNGANQALDPFAGNINMTYYPVVPNVGDQVVVDIRTTPTTNTSGGLINIGATLLVLDAWYPNGTFWRSWVGGFTPLAYPYNETWHARIYLPEDFFAHSGTRVEWFIEAYDQANHEIQSRNFTQVVSNIGICPDANFTACLNLTTDPQQIEQEGWTGWLPSTPPSIPGIAVNEAVNITITTLNRSIDIEAAYVILHVTYSQSGGSGAALYTLHRITLNVYYFDIPSLPEGSNVTFVVKAIDFNETSVISHPYRYFVPLTVNPPAAYCFFYIQVFNAQTNEPVNGVNLTITGLAGTIKITTVTAINGVAYPNVTGQQWTPRFLPANNTYSIKAQIPGGFVGSNLPAPGNIISVNLYCTHVMNTTAVLEAGSNYQVAIKDAVLNFTLNQLTSPPVYSPAVTETLGLPVLAGMICATAVLVPIYRHWRKQREIAEAEEKRITL